MRTPRTLTRSLAALALLTCVGAGLAAPAEAGAPGTTSTMGSASLLALEDLQDSGVAVDSATLDATGNAYLGDDGRFDEGSLGEKTMRSITGAKAAPAPGTAKAYFDGTWTSTTDKEVWAREALAQGRTAAAVDRWQATLEDAIARVAQCQQDPAQGHRYSRAFHEQVGAATVTYWMDLDATGRRTGGGAAVVRRGNRLGYLDLMGYAGRDLDTLRVLAINAAARL